MTARPLVLAHRGGALEAPENSLEAFERAIRLGYEGVELDVRASKDGVPVIIHDRQVKTQAGGRPQAVDHLTAAQLSALPTLDAVLALSWGKRTLMVEVKHDVKADRKNREVGVLVARAVKRSRLPNAVLASFSPDVLAAAHEAEPSVPLVPIVDDETFYKVDLRPLETLPLFAWAVDLSWLGVDEAAVRWLRERGGRLWVWTVRDLVELGAALALGVEGIITDIPGKVRAALAGPS